MKASNTTRCAGEPVAGVNRYGTLVAFWEDQCIAGTPLGRAMFAFSNDSGVSFDHTLTMSGASIQFDPTIATNSPNGTIFLGIADARSPTSDAVVHVWDNGSHWSDLVTTIPRSKAPGGNFLDRNWLASTPSGKLVHTVNTAGGPYIYEVHSQDGFAFSDPQVVYDDQRYNQATFAYDDSLFGGLTRNTTGVCIIFLTQDAGATYRVIPTPPPGCSGGTAFGRGPALDLAYPGTTAVHFTRSDDLGASWTPAKQISGNPASGTRFSKVSIATDLATGQVAVTWMDTREDTNNSHWNMYEADSPDNGVSWSPVRKLSDAVIGRGPTFWPGDYLWTVLTPWGTAGAVWGDNRSGTGVLETYFAQVPYQNSLLGNASVDVVDANDTAVAGALVEVDSRHARTDAAGSVTYYNLVPGAKTIRAEKPGVGEGNSGITVQPGTTVPVRIMLGAPLGASASANRTSGPAPLRITFDGGASGGTPPYSYSWDFGDGTPGSGVEDPGHSFALEGNYTTTLNVTDSAGKVANASLEIKVGPAPGGKPLAAFAAASPTSGIAPLAVDFTGTTSGGNPPFAFSWDFGDGSAPENGTAAIHVYTSPGNRIANLTVSDAKGSRATSDIVIEVRPPPPPPLQANATAEPTRGKAPLIAVFDATATGGVPPHRFRWEFGDGTPASVERAPAHTFDSPGEYEVRLTVNDSVSTSAVATISIVVSAPAAVPPAPEPPFYAHASFWLGASAVTLVVVAVIASLVVRRRRKRH